MNKVKAAFAPAAFLLMEQLYERELQREEMPGESKPPPLPPWVTAEYDIPKNQRKGKSWEEIIELKKQIWTERQAVKENTGSE